MISNVAARFSIPGRKKSICVYLDMLKLYIIFFHCSLFHAGNAKWGLSLITDTFPFIRKDFQF